MSKPISPEMGQEYAASEEAEDLARIEQTLVAKMKRTYPPSTRPAHRDAHAKAHGCVKAEFIVDEAIPPLLKHGVFREARVYPAWIRFSASAPAIQPDTKKDVHGMAVKLLGVAGEKLLAEEAEATTHDFMLANYPVFFIRNLPDYVQFTSALANGRLLSFFFGWNPLRWRRRELLLVLAIQKRIANPLQIQYWSQTPYRLGPHAIKFSARPAASKRSPDAVSARPDSLREAMQRQLTQEDVYFDFLVQVQTDAVKTPVEDSTILWNAALSPFVKVASIRIPKQDFGSPARREFAENLSFTPWHALAEQRPLGCMNRCRRVVYEAISKLRHEMNHAPRREPTDMAADVNAE